MPVASTSADRFSIAGPSQLTIMSPVEFCSHTISMFFFDQAYSTPNHRHHCYFYYHNCHPRHPNQDVSYYANAFSHKQTNHLFLCEYPNSGWRCNRGWDSVYSLSYKYIHVHVRIHTHKYTHVQIYVHAFVCRVDAAFCRES